MCNCVQYGRYLNVLYDESIMKINDLGMTNLAPDTRPDKIWSQQLVANLSHYYLYSVSQIIIKTLHTLKNAFNFGLWAWILLFYSFLNFTKRQ